MIITGNVGWGMGVRGEAGGGRQAGGGRRGEAGGETGGEAGGEASTGA
nr:hypothetical protein [Enterocloster clostridioformis]